MGVAFFERFSEGTFYNKKTVRVPSKCIKTPLVSTKSIIATYSLQLQEIKHIFAGKSRSSVKMQAFLKYSLTGILLILIGGSYINATNTTIAIDYQTQTCISQQDSDLKNIHELGYNYSDIYIEGLEIKDIQLLHFKSVFRFLLGNQQIKYTFQTSSFTDNHTHKYIHPNPVRYYIFALKKIVI